MKGRGRVQYSVIGGNKQEVGLSCAETTGGKEKKYFDFLEVRGGGKAMRATSGGSKKQSFSLVHRFEVAKTSR